MTAGERVSEAAEVAACAAEAEAGLRAYVVRLTPNRGLTPSSGMLLLCAGFLLVTNSFRLTSGVYQVDDWSALVAWTCFAAVIGHQFLWRWFGDETVRIVGDELTVERRLGGWARVRTYRLDDIESFRSGMVRGGHWHHMEWPNWRDDLLWAPFRCPGVGFRVAGRRWEQRFAVGMRPEDVTRVGEVVARYAEKPWVDDFVGTPLR